MYFNLTSGRCLFQEWNVTRLTFEYDSEPYGKERDAAIIKMAQEYGVETVVRNIHTLYNPDRWVMARFLNGSVKMCIRTARRIIFVAANTTKTFRLGFKHSLLDVDVLLRIVAVFWKRHSVCVVANKPSSGFSPLI